MNCLSTRSTALGLGGLLIGALLSLPVAALDDGYIDAIKADVAEFETKVFSPPAESAWLGAESGEAAQLADLAGFSNFLRKKSPGSYIFYKKLPTEYKEQLHQEYLATGDIERIKSDIFKYTREVRR